MSIFVTGPDSSYFFQFSFFFYVSCIFRTIGSYRFAFWLLAKNMLISHFHGFLVVWTSLIRRCPPLCSLVVLVCSFIWIWVFSCVRNDWGVLIHRCLYASNWSFFICFHDCPNLYHHTLIFTLLIVMLFFLHFFCTFWQE